MLKEVAMQQKSKSLNLFLIAALIILLFPTYRSSVHAQQATPAVSNSAQPACDSSRTVQVSGSATVNVTPDRATILLGVQSNGITPDAVQAANSLAIQKVIRAIAAQGVAAKDIATDIYVVEPVYEDYDSLYIKGYRINNVVEVTLREVAKTSTILVAALKAGANQVVSVEFSTSQLRSYRDQARLLAMQAAREKGQALAEAAGAKAGCVLNISENSWSYYNGWWSGRNLNNWAQNVVQNVGTNSGSTGGTGDEPISLGQISIKAEISASFALE
jgi:uncharacterized protein YggE